MTDSKSHPLFREQALREHAESNVRGRLLRISPSWNRWVFWLLLAALLGGAVFVSVVTIDEWRTGHVVVADPFTVVGLLPVEGDAHPRKGQLLWARFPGVAHGSKSGSADQRKAVALTIEAVGADIPLPPVLATRLGLPAATPLPEGIPYVLVRARFPEGGLLPNAEGHAEFVVGRRTLLEALRPGRESSDTGTP